MFLSVEGESESSCESSPATPLNSSGFSFVPIRSDMRFVKRIALSCKVKKPSE